MTASATTRTMNWINLGISLLAVPVVVPEHRSEEEVVPHQLTRTPPYIRVSGIPEEISLAFDVVLYLGGIQALEV